MKKVEVIIITAISVFGLMFSGIANNTKSYAVEVSKDIQITKELSDFAMPLGAGTYSTPTIEHSKDFYLGTEKTLELYQKVVWTYGGATGNYPIAPVYDFMATPSEGYIYSAIANKLREEVVYNGKTAVSYTEKGIYSGKRGAATAGVYVICNCDGEHKESFIER